MGSPKDTAITVDPVSWILDEQRVNIPPLTPEQCFEVMQSAVVKLQPDFRNVFKRTFQEVFEGTWEDVGPMPDLPLGLDARTKCVCIVVHRELCRILRSRRSLLGSREDFIIITRNGGMFLWDCDMTGEYPSHRLLPLSQEVFVKEWEEEGSYMHRHAVWSVLQGLAKEFRRAIGDIDGRRDPLDSQAGWLDRTMRRLP